MPTTIIDSIFGTHWTENDHKGIENVEEWIRSKIATDDESFYHGKMMGDCISAVEGAVACIRGFGTAASAVTTGAAGAGLTLTGGGAVLGVPAIVVSAGLVIEGAAEMGVGAGICDAAKSNFNSDKTKCQNAESPNVDDINIEDDKKELDKKALEIEKKEQEMSSASKGASKASKGGNSSWKRNLSEVGELDNSQFQNLKDNGIVKVNSSGSNRPLSGEPNSFYSTGNGEHVFVYDENGKLIYDISKLRVKAFKINVDPRGVEHYQAYKLAGEVSQAIKEIFGW